MPIITGLPKPIPVVISEPLEGKDFPIPGSYRFSGYSLRLDDDGNVIKVVPTMSQPAFWSNKAVSIVLMDARNP
jgi:hypothetical protein